MNQKLMCDLWYLAGTMQGLAIGVEFIKDIDTMVLADSIKDCGTQLQVIIEQIVKDEQNVGTYTGMARER